MSLEDSICKQCNQVGTELVSGLCPQCRTQNEATIAPTPNPQHDVTVAPGSNATNGSNGSNASNGNSSNVSPTTDRVGEYDLIEEIARGGMGVVYKANHRNLNRITAIKMVLGGRFSSAEELQRFQVEAESAAKLDHPAIIPIYEIGDVEGQAFFAMKYVDGGSLAETSKTFKHRPDEAVEILVKVSEAVHHAHQRGVLHRDLKPANILLDKDSQPYVTDLGLAKSTTGGSDLTHTGAVLGTPSYMPPEQAAGKSVTTAADIYSLGAIMFELLVGRPPYQGDTTLNIVMKVLEGPPESPSKIHSDVDRDLELICMKCLEREPEDRYATAQDLADDLKAWRRGDAISVKPPSFKAQISGWFRRNQKVTYAMFAILVATLICVPIALTFFSDDLGDVYDKFPDSTTKPFLFSFNFPGWLSVVFTVVLFLIVWPAIGFLNAIISKPRSIWGAWWSGISTAAVLALIFYALVGWFVVIQGVQNYSSNVIGILTQSVWPTGDMTQEEAIERANKLYGGLEEIPENERAQAVAKRLRADRFASVPYSFMVGTGIAFGFSIPIVYGTVLGYILARRRNPGWLFLIRYTFSWWATTFALVNSIPVTLWTFNLANVQSSITVNSIMLGVGIVVAWLSLRRWRKEPAKVVAGKKLAA